MNFNMISWRKIAPGVRPQRLKKISFREQAVKQLLEL